MGKVIEGQRKDKLQHIKLDLIVVEGRARENYGDIEELVNSIREKGVIQPITLNSNMKLLAGGRRFRASTELGLTTIPAIIRDAVDDVDELEIELIENTHRKDFEWDERCKLTKRIDDLYKAKHGTNWSGRKTAELLDRSKSQISRDLELANALEVMPELAEVDSPTEAYKVLKKMEDQAIVSELRSRQRTRLENEGHADSKLVQHQLENGLRTVLKMADSNYVITDVFKGMSGLKTNGHINIIECDPPYGIDLNEQKASKDSSTSNVHSYEEVGREDYPAFLETLTKELFRVAGKDCWLIFWYGPTWHGAVLDNLRRAGWIVDEIPAVWTKTQGQTMQPDKYFARGYEPFFLCRKGNPIMAERGRLNVFNFPGVAGKTKYHPTQRPVELIKTIFNTLGAGRQHVFVPFLGSGATLLACYDVGFHGFGFDLNGEYKDKFMLEVEAQTKKLYDTEKETE